MNARHNGESSPSDKHSTSGIFTQNRDIRAALKEAISRLRAAHVPSDTLTAEVLLMYALGCDRTWLYTHPESLLVSPAVLIPRPETEHVVEVVLERLGLCGIKIRMDTGAPSPHLRGADIGTGS